MFQTSICHFGFGWNFRVGSAALLAIWTHAKLISVRRTSSPSKTRDGLEVHPTNRDVVFVRILNSWGPAIYQVEGPARLG